MSHSVVKHQPCAMCDVEWAQGQSPLMLVDGLTLRPQVPQHTNTVILNQPPINILSNTNMTVIHARDKYACTWHWHWKTINETHHHIPTPFNHQHPPNSSLFQPSWNTQWHWSDIATVTSSLNWRTRLTYVSTVHRQKSTKLFVNKNKHATCTHTCTVCVKEEC